MVNNNSSRLKKCQSFSDLFNVTIDEEEEATLANSGGLTLLLANWLGSISLTLTLANVTCNYKHYDVSVKTVTSK